MIKNEKDFNDCIGFCVASAYLDREIRGVVLHLEASTTEFPEDVRGHLSFLLGAVLSRSHQEALARWGEPGRKLLATVIDTYCCTYGKTEKEPHS